MDTRRAPRRQERGIALILVLIVLPLVAIIMVQLNFETTIGQHLAANILANQQFKYAIRARVGQMRLRLVRDLKNDNQNVQQQGAFDHYSDEWGPDSEQGQTATVVRRGDKDQGDDITLYTEIVDEQSKFNINLLRHTDKKRAARATEVFRTLLDLYRDARYEDLEDNEWDLNDSEAEEVTQAVLTFLKGEERDQRIDASEIPAPSEDMKQGAFTVDDLVFAHRLFRTKRLLDRFVDAETGEQIPSLADFLTVYGDGRINVNTAPIQILRAMFRSEEGRAEVAKQILNGRGGFLDSEEDKEAADKLEEEREEMRQAGDEEGLDDSISVYTTVNDLTQNVSGFRDQALIRREELDLGRDFTTRSMFFTIIVSAQRENFVRQQRVTVERHATGTQTWSTEVRSVSLRDLPQTDVSDVATPE
jgi:type II secretory pathway component PulK